MNKQEADALEIVWNQVFRRIESRAAAEAHQVEEAGAETQPPPGVSPAAARGSQGSHPDLEQGQRT